MLRNAILADCNDIYELVCGLKNERLPHERLPEWLLRMYLLRLYLLKKETMFRQYCDWLFIQYLY